MATNARSLAGRSRRWAVFGALVMLFMLTFWVRAYQPMSRASMWVERASSFERALEAGDWKGTYLHDHPGVTTMAISGLALRADEIAVRNGAGAWLDWALAPHVTHTGRRMAVAVIGLAVVLAALNVTLALVLSRLAGWAVGLTSGWLIAFSPFILAYGRTPRTDPLLSMLMLLSVLLLLLGQERGRRLPIAGSGIVAGFAVLTKTPAAFLALYAAVALAVRAQNRSRIWQLWLLWGLSAIAPLFLWPAIWSDPIGVLGKVIGATNTYFHTPHEQPIFFRGQIYADVAPGWLFYPTTLLFDLSFVTLTLVVVALGAYTIWRRLRPTLTPGAFWLLVAYAMGFTLMMGAGAKQPGGRYLLPVHLVLEVVAAIGLVSVASSMVAGAKNRRRVLGMVVAGVVLLQAALAFTYFPDCGAHHNPLLGGNMVAERFVAVVAENEGITSVAEYLNRQPNAHSLRVAATQRAGNHLKQYFSGTVVRRDEPSEYRLFDISTLQRHIQPQSRERAWKHIQGGRPEMVVQFDGVEVFWLLAAKSQNGDTTFAVRRGWAGWVIVAWAWSIGLALCVARALRA